MKTTTAICALLLCAAWLAAGCEYERMTYQEHVRPYEQKMPDVVPGAVPVDGGEDRYRLAAPGSLTNPVAAEPGSITRGQTAYGYYCVQCHGARYNGDGTVGQSFFPLPTDLRSSRVQQQMGEEEIFRHISYGSEKSPPLAYTIAVTERWDLVNWIRALGLRPAGDTSVPSGDYPKPGN